MKDNKLKRQRTTLSIDSMDDLINSNINYNKGLYVCDSLSSGSTRSTGSGNASRTSISEIAGQRLYQNALETQRKIEEKSRERLKVEKRTLNLATRGRRSREPSPMAGQPPRYIQLYEQGKTKIALGAEKESQATQVRAPSPSRNESCERLYSLSAQKQQEGRERREEIKKSKLKPPLPESHYRKIPASQATKIYDRGMKHLISLEMKRMEAAFESEGNYASPLVPKSKKKGFTANE